MQSTGPCRAHADGDAFLLVQRCCRLRNLLPADSRGRPRTRLGCASPVPFINHRKIIMKRIAIFGLGYVGCVSAACLGDAGHQVWGVDLNADKVRMVNEGKSPLVEPGLDALLSKVARSGRLRATTSCEEAVANSDLAFLCVGTPGDEHGQLQLDAMRRVCEEIGQALKGSGREFTVIVSSTVLPGTTENEVWPALI